MKATAQQIFRELDSGKWQPFYLIVGEEPFQAAECLARLRRFFVKGGDDEFQYEAHEGEGIDGSFLLSSLEMLPGLFDGPDTIRCVVCRRFEKLSSAALDKVAPYFDNPSPTTCFVMTATKVDKRKHWFKAVSEKGAVIEVAEPGDREWPKWQGYFEKRLEKRFAPAAWEALLEGSGRQLAVLWSDLQRVALFVGEKPTVEYEEALAFCGPAGAEDVFSFAEDVVGRRAFAALAKLHTLLHHGESESKLLSILVRQFRQVAQCAALWGQGVQDSRVIAAQIGIPPFFVSKIQQQAKQHSEGALKRTFSLLAECDYRLKVGEGSLLENFLVPYFSNQAV